MHNTHRLDLLPWVGLQSGFNLGRVSTVAPVTGQKFHLDAKLLGHLFPQRRKVPGLGHQHQVAAAQGIDQCGLPGTGARGRINHHIRLRFENFFQPRKNFFGHCGELWPAVVDGDVVDRAQHAVWHVGRPWNLQEMATGRMGI